MHGYIKFKTYITKFLPDCWKKLFWNFPVVFCKDILQCYVSLFATCIGESVNYDDKEVLVFIVVKYEIFCLYLFDI
jgi:hypothetical protein